LETDGCYLLYGVYADIMLHYIDERNIKPHTGSPVELSTSGMRVYNERDTAATSLERERYSCN
jgi:hypothetical protein